MAIPAFSRWEGWGFVCLAKRAETQDAAQYAGGLCGEPPLPAAHFHMRVNKVIEIIVLALIVQYSRNWILIVDFPIAVAQKVCYSITKSLLLLRFVSRYDNCESFDSVSES